MVLSVSTEIRIDMDRREHPRHRTKTTVYLAMPGRKGRACWVRNLSANGVFIETGDLDLQHGQEVALTFTIQMGSVTRIHRRTAVVARVCNNGSGFRMRRAPER